MDAVEKLAFRGATDLRGNREPCKIPNRSCIIIKRRKKNESVERLLYSVVG